MVVKFIRYTLLLIIVALVIAGISLAIYVYVRYGNVPIEDLPAWVLPFFLGK